MSDTIAMISAAIASSKHMHQPRYRRGTSYVVRVKQYLYSTTGQEYRGKVLESTIAAIERFKGPEGFQQEGGREDSFLYSPGNYIKPSCLCHEAHHSRTAISRKVKTNSRSMKSIKIYRCSPKRELFLLWVEICSFSFHVSGTPPPIFEETTVLLL